MQIDNPTLFDMAALPMIGPKGKSQLTIIVKAAFLFDGGGADPAVPQVPLAYGDIYDEQSGALRYESDILPYKPRTDIVLWATAHAPGGQPAKSVAVRISVGLLEKRLLVFGDRLWNHAGLLSRKYTPTHTRPFVTRPILYQDAFGGIDEISGRFCAENPWGKGFYTDSGKTSLAGKPLPGIEDPDHLIRSLHDRPKPAGFAFYPRSAQPRAAYAGTYDDTWRKNRSPLPPEDFNPRFYNGAHPDLQTAGFLKGNEPVTLLNLTPEGLAEFQLPGMQPACRIVRNANGQQKKTVLSMNLDTLFIEPEKRRYHLIWRTGAKLKDLSAAEIDQVALRFSQKNPSEIEGG